MTRNIKTRRWPSFERVGRNVRRVYEIPANIRTSFKKKMVGDAPSKKIRSRGEGRGPIRFPRVNRFNLFGK